MLLGHRRRIQIRVAIPRHYLKELPCKRLMWHRANLPAFAGHAGGDCQYLAGDQVGSPVRLRVNLAGDGVAFDMKVHGGMVQASHNGSAFETTVEIKSRPKAA